MAKFNDITLKTWAAKAEEFLAPYNLTRSSIMTGRDAWAIASRTNITRDAYEDRNVTDGHIQTALEKIFPNAVFKDKKVY